MEKMHVVHSPSGNSWDLWPIGAKLQGGGLITEVTIVGYDWQPDGTFASQTGKAGTIFWCY
ncbi:MAG: hypothetical protein V1685_02375 [Parcubacteria group bacterium]